MRKDLEQISLIVAIAILIGSIVGPEVASQVLHKPCAIPSLR